MALVFAFLFFVFNSFSCEFNLADIHSLRTASMQKELIHRGAAKSISLKSLSAENLEREMAKLAGSLTLSPSLNMRLLKALDSIRLEFVHNTKSAPEDIEDLIYSAQWVNKLSLGWGLNSKNIFNRNFLRSDNNVFFNVAFQKKDQLRQVVRTLFGASEAVLDEEFAKQEGWISPYIMYPHELEHLLWTVDYKLFDNFSGKFKKFLENASYDKKKKLSMNDVFHFYPKLSQDFLDEHSEIFSLVIKKLHMYDFTVADFDYLWRFVLIDALAKEYEEHPAGILLFVNELESQENVQRLIVDKLSSTWLATTRNGFELKVPVAVPVEKITIYEH